MTSADLAFLGLTAFALFLGGGWYLASEALQHARAQVACLRHWNEAKQATIAEQARLLQRLAGLAEATDDEIAQATRRAEALTQP